MYRSAILPFEDFDEREATNLALMNTLNDSVTDLLVGKESGAAGMNVFSTKNHTTATYIRNSNLWCNELVSQLTGLSAYKRCLPLAHWLIESGGIVMITPRHGIGCRHFHPHASGTWGADLGVAFDALHRFIKVDGTVWGPQQIGQGYYLQNNPHLKRAFMDLAIVVFSEPAPAGIHIIPIGQMPYRYNIDADEEDGTFTIHATQGTGRDRGMELNPPSPASDYPQYNDSMICIRSTKGIANVPVGYKYTTYTGDSGTPQFVNKNGTLYLYGISILGGDDPSYKTHNIAGFINELILKADQDAMSRGLLASPTGLLPTYVKL